MTLDDVETPSEWRFVGCYLVAGVGALVVVSYGELGGGALLALAIAILALLTFADAYWRARC